MEKKWLPAETNKPVGVQCTKLQLSRIFVIFRPALIALRSPSPRQECARNDRRQEHDLKQRPAAAERVESASSTWATSSQRLSRGPSKRRRTWFGFPAARSAWDRTSTTRKKRRSIASASTDFWIDTSAGHQPAIRRIRQRATGHVTFAEIPPDPKDYPGALPHMLYAGSLVFTPPAHPVDLRDWGEWWTFMKGADWRHPYGPKSNIDAARRSPGRARRLCATR